MAKDASNQPVFTHSVRDAKSTAPHFLRDGSLVYLQGGKENGRSVTQVWRAEVATGRTAPLTGTDLVVADFCPSPAGDLLGLVVNVQVGGRPFFKVYLQPVPGGAPVPLPTTG